MHGVRKSPVQGCPVNMPSNNPFDSDDELDNKHTLKISRRTSSEPSVFTSNLSTNPFDDGEKNCTGSSSQSNLSATSKTRCKNDNKQTLKLPGRTPSEHSQVTSNLSANPFDDGERNSSSSSSQSNLFSASKTRFKNDNKQTLKIPGRRTPSEPSQVTSNLSTNPFDDGVRNSSSSSSQSNIYSASKTRYKNDFHDSGGLENQSVQELENYAAYRAEETTKTAYDCLKIAEDIREDATKTLVTLHQQGEQITRTHMVAADMDHDLSRGEKLLGSLGGIFSKTWKPKRLRPITGPVITRDDPVQRKGNHLEQRERLGLTSASKERTSTRTPPLEPTSALQKVEVEKVKQDDALLDLSNILGDLKEMAIDMGSEIDRQNKALDHVQDDVDELNFRVKSANQRTRRLLGK